MQVIKRETAIANGLHEVSFRCMAQRGEIGGISEQGYVLRDQRGLYLVFDSRKLLHTLQPSRATIFPSVRECAAAIGRFFDRHYPMGDEVMEAYFDGCSREFVVID